MGFTTKDLENYPTDRAMRFAQRIILDLRYIRPDTYLKPIAEMLPELLSQLHDLKKVTGSNKTNIIGVGKLKTKFPKTWVT